MMKTAKEMGEKVKGNIRATRQGARDVLKRRYKGVYGEDEVKRIEKEVSTSGAERYTGGAIHEWSEWKGRETWLGWEADVV